MKIARLLVVAIAGLFAIAPAIAKNFAVPTKNPAITITMPDNWKTQEIDNGYTALPPDDSVFFSVEFADARGTDKMLENTAAWMKDNKIKKVEPIKADGLLNGMPVMVFEFQTTDESGPTKLDLFLLPASNNRMILLTIWAAHAERETYRKELDAIFASIKSIN